MPDISASIRTLLLADADISTLVGTRVYSDALPQSATMPAIVYSVVSTTPPGCLSVIVDVTSARIQIDCFGDTRSKANVLANHVRLALDLQNHVLSGTQYINAITTDSGEAHLFDGVEEGSDKRRYITTQDFNVHYRQTTS